MVKKGISFTIEEGLIKRWRDYAKRKSINSSMFVEGLLRNYLINHEYIK